MLYLGIFETLISDILPTLYIHTKSKTLKYPSHAFGNAYYIVQLTSLPSLWTELQWEELNDWSNFHLQRDTFYARVGVVINEAIADSSTLPLNDGRGTANLQRHHFFLLLSTAASLQGSRFGVVRLKQFKGHAALIMYKWYYYYHITPCWRSWVMALFLTVGVIIQMAMIYMLRDGGKFKKYDFF